MEKRARHWHLRVQFAGYQGLISVGGGPVLARGRWHPGLMYGFAPPAGDRPAVHQIIVRNDLIFRPDPSDRKFHVSPSLSANLLIETGRYSYLKLPSEFPAGYYAAPQLHGTLGLGARWIRRMPDGSLFRNVSFSAEFTGLDTYIWYSISERGIPISDAFGLSFALAASF